jgi:small conductance mechanosensitive channel
VPHYLRFLLRTLIAPLFLVILVGTFALALLPATAIAQEATADKEAATSPSPATTQEIDQLIKILENEDARNRLIEQLRSAATGEPAKPAPTGEEPGGFATQTLATLADGATSIGAHLFDALSFIQQAPRLLKWLQLTASQPHKRQQIGMSLLQLAIALGVGLLNEVVVALALRRVHDRIGRNGALAFWRRLGRAGLGLLLGLVPIIAFWIVATTALALLQPAETTSLIAVVLINAHAAAQALVLLARQILAPRTPGMRLVPLPDGLAQSIERWVRRIVRIALYGYALALATLFVGLPQVLVSFVMKLLGVIIAILLVLLVLRLRRAIASLVKSRPATSRFSARSPIVRFWHLPALAYILMALFIWLARTGDAMAYLARATVLTLIVIAVGAGIVAATDHFLFRSISRMSWLDRRDSSFRARALRYIGAARFALIVAAVWIGILVIAEGWELDAAAWFEEVGGMRLVSSLVSIALIVAIAIAAWEAVSIVIERRLAATDDGTLEGLRRAARLRTLMPLFDRITFLILAICVVMIALSELGIDIAPLLAGAGVVGIAVGFGAQALVKDVFAGMSAILEGSMSVGDIVSLGDKGGVVESMSLRVLRLRDFDGTVHTIPFGEITRISNRTKDYAYSVLRVAVSYDADIVTVQRMMTDIAKEMRAEPNYRMAILDDIELHGVDAFVDTGVVLLARLKTAPAKQWAVYRDFYTRLKERMDDAGIAFQPRAAIAGAGLFKRLQATLQGQTAAEGPVGPA